MSNYAEEQDKLQTHLDELVRKHRSLDTELEKRYNNQTITEEVRRMKTMKLYLKDEIHRIQTRLLELK